jgi:2-polyprenyl-3-methyl-5-hydroxy-6-metoxy-1,4-benzoquinol methylase
MTAWTDSDRAWQRWGETEPYFGVLAADRFRKASFAENSEEFWHLGDAQVAERLAAAEREFGPVPRDRALDFGCGVGRLSLPLARRFGQVVALDIAPAMLDEARRNADAAGLANLCFARSDDALGEAGGRFDFVMSFIVFQHIPVRRGMRVLGAMLDKVDRGGVAALDLCIDRRDTPAQALRYWAQRHVPGLHGLFNRARGRPVGEPFMQMNAYRLDAVETLATSLGFGPAVVATVTHGRFMTAQLIMRRDEIPVS